MPAQPGQMLSHYRLVEKIGEGGMGVVWKALDTTLDRDVAVKILPDTFAGDPERLARFEREAKTLASLNHSHIATVYGLHEEGDVRFIAMELAPGEDLAQRLTRGAMPMEEALEVTRQISEALEAAHEQGIVHRDLKPANVKVGADGTVKVLDFGLAKALAAEPAESDPALSPTVTSVGTRAGLILGTAAYMSPEQARGKPLDKRTDIWSFGCVLYECLTGKRAFQGETTTDILAAILQTEPDWSPLPDGTPPRIQVLLHRCLEKDARNRLRDIGDARLELRTGAAGDSEITGGVPPVKEARPFRSRLGSPLLLIAALLVGALLGIAGWSRLVPSRSATAGESGVVRFAFRPPEGWIPLPTPKVSPNGRFIAYAARPETPDDEEQATRIFVRSLDDAESKAVQGSERAQNIRFSPDGRWLAFDVPSPADSRQRRLVKVPVDGSAPPLELATLPENVSRGARWISDDELIVLTRSPQSLIRIPAGGAPPGPPTSIETVGFEENVFLASALPGERHVLVTSAFWGENRWSWRVGLLDVETGQARLLLEDAWSPRWSPTGHLLFTRQDSLLAVPFDAKRLEVTGGPVAITDGLRTISAWDSANFNVSQTGTLVHFAGGVVGANRQFVWLLPDGTLEPWSNERHPVMGDLGVTSDGLRFSVSIVPPSGFSEIWGSELDRPNLKRLVSLPAKDCSTGVWTHDGTHLAFTVRGNLGVDGLFIQEVGGPARPRQILQNKSPGDTWHPLSFSPDGSWLLAGRVSGGITDLVLVEANWADEGLWKSRTLLENAFRGSFSPDGQWIVYGTRSSGPREIYIRRFVANGTLGPPIPVPFPGIEQIAFGYRKQPLQLWYIANDELYRVDVHTEPALTLSEPVLDRVVSDVLPKTAGGALLPDGRSFGIIKGEEEKDPEEIQVVVNWFDELQQKLAASR